MKNRPFNRGDLVRLDSGSYPQYAGLTGVLIDYGVHASSSIPWQVMIDGRLHPFYVNQNEMELVSENR